MAAHELLQAAGHGRGDATRCGAAAGTARPRTPRDDLDAIDAGLRAGAAARRGAAGRRARRAAAAAAASRSTWRASSRTACDMLEPEIERQAPGSTSIRCRSWTATARCSAASSATWSPTRSSTARAPAARSASRGTLARPAGRSPSTATAADPGARAERIFEPWRRGRGERRAQGRRPRPRDRAPDRRAPRRRGRRAAPNGRRQPLLLHAPGLSADAPGRRRAAHALARARPPPRASARPACAGCSSRACGRSRSRARAVRDLVGGHVSARAGRRTSHSRGVSGDLTGRSPRPAAGMRRSCSTSRMLAGARSPPRPRARRAGRAAARRRRRPWRGSPRRRRAGSRRPMSSSSPVVRITMTWSGDSLMILRVAAMPSSSGMTMSIRTTSGL